MCLIVQTFFVENLWHWSLSAWTMPTRSKMESAHSTLLGISTFLVWLLVLTGADAQTRTSEVEALFSFKEYVLSTVLFTEEVVIVNSEQYWNSWNETDINACAWVGVYCTANSMVERLDLSSWGITIFPDLDLLSNLTDLRELNLSSNMPVATPLSLYITGPITRGVSGLTLTRLSGLDLSNNNFYDTIPPDISNWTNLRYLSLAGNQFTGGIPSLSRLSKLQVLRLANNQLSSEFPIELLEVSSLVSIDLSDNMFNGTIPFLSNSTKLLDLKLDNNNFTEFQGPLFPSGANGLEYLFVSQNRLEGAIPTGITTLPNLQYLYMSGNRLSGSIPNGLTGQPRSDLFIALSRNQLTRNIPTDLGLAVPLSISLNLSNNLLTGHLLPFVGDTYYVSVDLSNNNLIGNLNSSYIANVEVLRLDGNSLSEDLVDAFVEASGQSTMYTLSVPMELRLGNNLFTGDLSTLEKIQNVSWENLQVLDLSNNLLQMSSMEINLDPLTATLEFFTPYSTYGQISLTELRLGGNNFSGASLLTSFLTSNTMLQVLDFSQSHLNGEISGAVFNSRWFPSLQSLDLSDNHLTGPVPESVIQLPNLASLDVTNNLLSGLLPFIPQYSPLYSPRPFLGNPGLCGDPLPPCPTTGKGVPLWVLCLIVGGCAILVMGSCLAAIWQWRLYHQRHQQDVDLIKTLMERDSASLMPLRELKKATNNFSKSAQIGEGGFGMVYKGELEDGTMVAIKRSKRNDSETAKEQFLNEVKILSHLNHRNLVKLLGCCMENKIAVLVFEFVSNGTLKEHLQGKLGGTRLSWKRRLDIAVQTADALNYLHSASTPHIYHRDVKSANILLDNELNAKVADFGISKLVSMKSTHVSTMGIQGTIGYIDPESYASGQLTAKSDVYSFGVVLLELISAKPAVDLARKREEINLLIFARPHIKSGDLQHLLDPALRETYEDPVGRVRDSILNVGRLALKCLNMRSKARPNMGDVGRELQALRFQLSGTSNHLGFIDKDGIGTSENLDFDDEDGNDDSQQDHTNFASKLFSDDTSSFSLRNDVRRIHPGMEMTDFSSLPR